MNASQLRDDVIQRLEDAKEHISSSVVFIDDIEANGHAMCAIKEIGFVVDTLQRALDRLEKRAKLADDDAPSVSDVAEAQQPKVDIKGMVSALASKNRGASP